MFIKNQLFRVDFSHYAENHFCKMFSKKYKWKWIHTKRTIQFALERIYELQKKSSIDFLSYSQEDNVGIFKFDFRIAGTNVSPKAAGNRVIFILNNRESKIDILIVYGKNHCDKKHSETQWIYKQIKENFPDFKKYCK